MFDSILVPLDRSELAEQALGTAAAIARAAGGTLDLVLVHQPFQFGGFEEAPWNSQTRAEEEQYLEGIASELAAGASITTTFAVFTGEPVDEICGRVAEVNADLVIMTSHGRTGLTRAWLGSVAHGVLRNSGVPVLVLRRPEEERDQGAVRSHEGRGRLFEHVLVPIDESHLSASIIPTAVALAALGGGRVTLLRVVQPPPLIIPEIGAPVAAPPMVPDPAATERVAAEARRSVAALAEQAGTAGSVTGYVLVHDHVASAILDFAGANEVDLIAMMTHGRGGASRLLMGSVADRVLRSCRLPMLLHRPTPEPADAQT